MRAWQHCIAESKPCTWLAVRCMTVLPGGWPLLALSMQWAGVLSAAGRRLHMRDHLCSTDSVKVHYLSICLPLNRAARVRTSIRRTLVCSFLVWRQLLLSCMLMHVCHALATRLLRAVGCLPIPPPGLAPNNPWKEQRSTPPPGLAPRPFQVLHPGLVLVRVLPAFVPHVAVH